ncbi:MAG TPA: transposase [Chloroflexota bacterium]|jgi:hypothetical protein
MTTTPLTAADLLRVGAWLEREGDLFEVTAWDARSPMRVDARAATGASRVFSLTELFAPTPPTRFAATRAELEAPSGAATAPAGAVDAVALPAHLLARAERVIRTVEAVQALLARSRQRWRMGTDALSLTELTRRACQALPIPVSLSAYYADRRLYQAAGGDRARLAAALHRTTHGRTRVDPNAQHFVDALVRRFYRANPPVRAQTVYAVAQQLWAHNRGWWLDARRAGDADAAELVERLLDARQEIDPLLADPDRARRLVQIPLPSRTWFYGHVRWFEAQPGEGAATYVVRHGRADWEASFLLFDRFAQTATLPLQYVCADHYRLDVLHVDDERREALGRLWLTVLVDAFSRAVLGLSLADEAPCIESIQGALRHAVWPKTDLAVFGVDLPWVCFGVPQRLSLDNAWAHQSHSLEDLARSLADGGRYTAMELLFRPPYQARYGGLVERLFGNLAEQLRERLPGATLGPDRRRWHDASRGACLLQRDLRRVVHQLVVDYLHTPHRELGGRTPHEQWLAGLALMAPVPPPLTPHLERCFWRLHPSPRRATHGGLALFGLHYWDAGLAGLRAPDRRGRPRRFHLRYDPADLSRVAVFEEGVWLGDAHARELRLPDGGHEPASRWELGLAKELARRRGGRAPRPHSWLLHLLETRELVAQRRAEQKVVRRQLQQLRDRRAGQPPAVSAAQRAAAEAASRQQTDRAVAAPPARGRDPRARLFDALGEVL